MLTGNYMCAVYVRNKKSKGYRSLPTIDRCSAAGHEHRLWFGTTQEEYSESTVVVRCICEMQNPPED